MTITEMVDRYCELRKRIEKDDDDTVLREMDALEYRLSLSKPTSLEELHVLAQLLYVLKLEDLTTGDNVCMVDREELNLIESIMEFFASAEPYADTADTADPVIGNLISGSSESCYKGPLRPLPATSCHSEPLPDVVPLLWKEYNDALARAESVGELTEGFYDRLDAEGKAKYKEQYPEFDPLLCESIEHKKAIDACDTAMDKFYKAPANTPEGVMLHVDFLISELWGDEMANAIKSTIKAGLANLKAA